MWRKVTLGKCGEPETFNVGSVALNADISLNTDVGESTFYKASIMQAISRPNIAYRTSLSKMLLIGMCGVK